MIGRYAPGEEDLEELGNGEGEEGGDKGEAGEEGGRLGDASREGVARRHHLSHGRRCVGRSAVAVEGVTGRGRDRGCLPRRGFLYLGAFEELTK